MAEAMNELITRNNMSVTELVIKENALIDLFENPKTGKVFFTCGSIRSGYLSPKVREQLENGASLEEVLEHAQYAEVSNDNGQTFVPTIMSGGAKKVGSFGANLLRSK